MIDLLGRLSARAACTQGLCGCVGYEEEGPVEGQALTVGRTAAPVVGYAEGEGVGRDAQIGHDWGHLGLGGGLNTVQTAIYALPVR